MEKNNKTQSPVNIALIQNSDDNDEEVHISQPHLVMKMIKYPY